MTDQTREAFEAWYEETDASEGPASWSAWQAATKAEREACALVCTKRNLGDGSREDQEAVNCANAIKRRGE